MARRGRPSKPFFADEDRYLVALMEAFLRRIRINSQEPSIRDAAKRAVAVHEFKLHDFSRHHGPPPSEPAAPGLRKSPIKKSLKNGYHEYTFVHALPERRPTGGAVFDAAVDRLRQKHRAWTQSGSGMEQDWLELMSWAWAAVLYPDVLQQKTRADPESFCACAAAMAGESEFAHEVMLPLLRQQRRNLKAA